MLQKAQSEPLTREQFEQQSRELAVQFYEVLKGRTLSTGVVLQALMTTHRYITTHLSQEERATLSLAMASYAGDLLGQAMPVNHTTACAPTTSTVH